MTGCEVSDPLPDERQDPLPEGSFFWRRIFSGVAVLLLLGITFWIAWGLTEALLEVVKGNSDATAIAEAMRDVAFYSLCLAGCISTYYLLAPSGEQLALIVQSAKIALAKIPGLGSAAEPAPRKTYRDDDDDFAPKPRNRR